MTDGDCYCPFPVIGGTAASVSGMNVDVVAITSSVYGPNGNSYGQLVCRKRQIEDSYSYGFGKLGYTEKVPEASRETNGETRRKSGIYFVPAF